VSEDPQAVRNQILSKYKIAESGDYYGLLGVKKGAGTDEIRKSYFALAKNLHPDKVGRLGIDDVKPQATKLFKLITEAYNTLSDPAKRKEYDSGAIKAATPNASAAAATAAASANVEASKIAYHKGSVMMQKRAYSEAEEFFREATEINAEVARYWQSLGWAIFNNENARTTDQRLEAAKKAYEKALELDDSDAQTHYNIGLYWKAKQDSKRMRRAMEKAISNDRGHINAKRELRLLKMREGKNKTLEKPPEGFFKNLWHQLTKKR